MSDIPEEIMKEANEIMHRAWASHFTQDGLDLIARALLSAEARGMERGKEAAKKAIEAYSDELGQAHEADTRGLVVDITCSDLIAEIRNGTEV